MISHIIQIVAERVWEARNRIKLRLLFILTESSVVLFRRRREWGNGIEEVKARLLATHDLWLVFFKFISIKQTSLL